MRRFLVTVFSGLVLAVGGAILANRSRSGTDSCPLDIAEPQSVRSPHASRFACIGKSKKNKFGSLPIRTSRNLASVDQLTDESSGPTIQPPNDRRMPESLLPHCDSNSVTTSAGSLAHDRDDPSSNGMTSISVDEEADALGADDLSHTAIQLANDVQLPAVLMPPDNAHRTLPADTAAQEIVNSFYRNLQTSADTDVSYQRERSSEATVIIPQNPSTADARNLANEQFRALFGIEAYNQKTLESTIEVQLPPN